MRKIKIFFFLLTKAKFVFKEPNHTKVVIIDPISSVDIVKALKKFNPFLLNNRIEQINKIYISIKIITFLIKNLFKRSLKINYFLALINVINPKVLVTRIDTSRDFSILSKILYKKIHCISLQQGMRLLPDNKNLHRTDTPKKDIKNYFIPEFFVFSNSDKLFFSNLKAKVINYHIAGSIRAQTALNYFKLKKIKKTILYDFCLISDPDKYSTTGYIAKYLHDFCKEKNFSYVIAAETNLKDGSEMKFYREFTGDRNINIIRNIKNQYTSYRLVLQSKVVVGQLSTLLKEALSYNKKIFTINGFNYNFSNLDLCIFNKNRTKNFWQPRNESYSRFKNFAIKIYKMSNFEYSKKFKNRDDLMKRNQDTVKFLKKKIIYFLKKKNIQNNDTI